MNYQYQSLPNEQAKTILDKLRKGETVNAEQFIKITGSGELFEIDNLSSLAKKILDLRDEIKGQSADAQFEAAAAPILHQHLELPEEIAGNRDFWTWFTFVAAQGDFVHVVKRRFSKGLMADDENFGIVNHSKLYEGLFARLWWRGHRFYDEKADDPYDIARRGYLDLWRSHIVRPCYGASRTMARALIEFLYPEKNQISGPKTEYIRALAKLVSAENSVTAFELLSLEECKEVLKDLSEMIPQTDSDDD